MKEIFLQPKEKDLREAIVQADEYVRTALPLGQAYLYSPKGEPIIFKNEVGFVRKDDN